MSEIPDYFSELTGWRKFNVRGPKHAQVLVSVNHPTPWLSADPGEAVCLDDGSTFTTPSDLVPCQKHTQGYVLAEVRLWGRCVEHARGYRSERIRIAALHVLKSFGDDTAAFERRYQVPIIREEKNAWISETLSVSSLLNQLGSLQQSGLFSQQALQNTINQYQSNYLQALGAMQQSAQMCAAQTTQAMRDAEAQEAKQKSSAKGYASRVPWLGISW